MGDIRKFEIGKSVEVRIGYEDGHAEITVKTLLKNFTTRIEPAQIEDGAAKIRTILDDATAWIKKVAGGAVRETTQEKKK